jgi:hypothetical protein
MSDCTCCAHVFNFPISPPGDQNVLTTTSSHLHRIVSLDSRRIITSLSLNYSHLRPNYPFLTKHSLTCAPAAAEEHSLDDHDRITRTTHSFNQHVLLHRNRCSLRGQHCRSGHSRQAWRQHLHYSPRRVLFLCRCSRLQDRHQPRRLLAQRR